jgi:hypothetical protein
MRTLAAGLALGSLGEWEVPGIWARVAVHIEGPAPKHASLPSSRPLTRTSPRLDEVGFESPPLVSQIVHFLLCRCDDPVRQRRKQ